MRQATFAFINVNTNHLEWRVYLSFTRNTANKMIRMYLIIKIETRTSQLLDFWFAIEL